MRVDVDRGYFASPPQDDFRLQVAHLHDAASRIQYIQQSLNNGTLACAIGTEDNYFQFVLTLQSIRVQSRCNRIAVRDSRRIMV